MREFPASNPFPDPARQDDLGPGKIPDHLVDQFFDGELSRDESSRLFSALSADAAAARDLVRTQRAIDALRQPVRTPDLSRAILARVNERRPLLTRRSVRRVHAGRLAAALAFLGVVAGAFLVQRFSPQVTRLGPDQPAPLANLSAGFAEDTAEALTTMRLTAQAIGTTAVSALPSSGASEPANLRARLIPDLAFPWRQQSGQPSDVAWIVPCGAAPCEAPRSTPPGAFILIDVRADTATPQSGAGRR